MCLGFADTLTDIQKSTESSAMEHPLNYQFSGHGTFTLRSNWLKRLYDECVADPMIFTRVDALVRFGVGKNMVDSIKHWGIVTGIIEAHHERGWQPTRMAHTLFGVDGIDPYLVTPWSRWWLHWQLVNSSAFSWNYVFMQMASNQIDKEQITRDIASTIGTLGVKIPSQDVLKRDISCLVNSYVAPQYSSSEIEETLLSPLISLNLLQDNGEAIRIISNERDDLPDSIFLCAVGQAMIASGRTTISFSEIMWGRNGPGRMFRLTEDALLFRISKLEQMTHGQAMYSDHAGVRSVMWQNVHEFDVNEHVHSHLHQEVGR